MNKPRSADELPVSWMLCRSFLFIPKLHDQSLSTLVGGLPTHKDMEKEGKTTLPKPRWLGAAWRFGESGLRITEADGDPEVDLWLSFSL